MGKLKKGGHNHGHGHSHASHSHTHSHSHSHTHSHDSDAKFCGCCKVSNQTRLASMLVMTFFFFVIELVTGHITKSIALVTDSFHMLSDSLALVIGLVSVVLSKKKSSKNTFGWVRAEILGALVNSVFLVSLCLGIIVEAVERLIEQKEINEPKLLLIVGVIGLTINLIGLFIFGHAHSHDLPTIPKESDIENEINGDIIEEGDEHEAQRMIVKSQAEETETRVATEGSQTASPNNRNENKGHSHENNHHHGHSHSAAKKSNSSSKKKNRCHIMSAEANMNMRAVFLHVMADALGSVIVIISALLNVYRKPLNIPDQIITLIDPVLCLALVVLILLSTLPLLKESALILLQTVPKEIEIDKLKSKIKEINGISAVHELHVWKLSGNKIIATAHVTCHNSVEYMEIATQLKNFFHKEGIHSTTIQPEFVDEYPAPDDVATNNCILECKETSCNQNTCCGSDPPQANEAGKSATPPKPSSQCVEIQMSEKGTE